MAGTASGRNWFTSGGESYARYRPTYPEALPAFLAEVAPDNVLAVDVGCGNGQFTCQLARHFAEVVGVDPSESQLANAVPHERVRYVHAPAESLGLPDRSASLIVAAQAAHWFDLPHFYAKVRRIAVPGAALALVSYGIPSFDRVINERFLRFYREEIGDYWPPERKLVESGYAGIDFPFPAIPYPPMAIRRDWDLAALLGYVTTWSATRAVEEAGRHDLLDTFAADMERLWGDPARTRAVVWPITMRLGRL
ncbi:MAG: class I SAM-dependent methyltransferase [Sphingobium sp.]